MRYRACTHRIEPMARRITGPIRLTTRLHPDEGIDIRVSSLRCRASPEPGIADVAPLAPFGLDCELACTALVDDEVGRDAVGFEVRGEGVSVVEFVPGVGPFGEVLAGVGDVCYWSKGMLVGRSPATRGREKAKLTIVV